jgi:hypothetical protein
MLQTSQQRNNPGNRRKLGSVNDILHTRPALPSVHLTTGTRHALDCAAVPC